MSKTWSTEATLMKSAASAKYRPGQMLCWVINYMSSPEAYGNQPSSEPEHEVRGIADCGIEGTVSNEPFWTE